MSTFTEDLLEYFADEIASHHIDVGNDDTEYFKAIADRFPHQGSKVAWSLVPGAIQSTSTSNVVEQQEWLEFLKHCIENQKLVGDCVVVGDSAIDVRLRLSLDLLQQHAEEILSYPQHTYVLAPDTSWCMAFTMEGEMNFGYAPIEAS